jgi:hypothetical protein
MDHNTEAGVTELLRRATHGMTPNAGDLLEHATESGRRTRRRHLAATALLGLGVLAGSVAVAPAIVDSLAGGDSGAAGVPADHSSTRRHLAVSPDQFAQTLSRLLPGDDPRSDLSNQFNKVDGVRSGSLVWRGSTIFVGIDSAADPITDHPGGNYGSGPSPSPRPAPKTAADWCHAMDGDRCTELPNGDWTNSNDAAEPGDPSNFQTTYTLFTTDGYMIFAQAHGLDPHVATRATSSPLTVAQLRDIVENGGWLAK